MSRRTRLIALAAAVVLQLALIAVAVAPRLSARISGDVYLLRTAPLDPIDPFRGSYVTLAYPDLLAAENPGVDRGRVYVPLVRSGEMSAAGELWRGGDALTRRPSSGPYISCEWDDFRLQCGIESLFLPSGKARQLERDLVASGGIARVKVDGRGNAAVVSVTAAPRLRPAW